jgi:hypothetical protein
MLQERSIIELQKEKEEHLYTVIIRVDETQEVFIDQVRTEATHLNKILFAWVEQAVTRGFIKDTDDTKVVFRDTIEPNNHMKALDGVFNIELPLKKGQLSKGINNLAFSLIRLPHYSPSARLFFWPHLGEKYDLLDRSCIGHNHGKPVNSNTHTYGRWHAVAQST